MPLHDAEFAPWVGGLFVAPEWRGQRVGTALLAAAVAASVALGVPSVSLYCNTAKPKLIEFYKRNGFAEVEVAVAPGSDEICKVADFGLSRGPTTTRTVRARITTRALRGCFRCGGHRPEAMDTLKFSPASDVWSFGIVVVKI